MKKRSIALTLLLMTIVGCTPNNGASSNSTGPKGNAVEEFNNLINSNRVDIEAELNLVGTKIPLFNLYQDEEKSVVTYTKRPDVKIINTKECSVIEGDDIKAKLVVDNSGEFIHEDININNYIESVKTGNNDLKCVLDLKNLSRYSNFFVSSDLDSFLNRYGIAIDKADTTVTFENNKVKTISLYLDDSVGLSLIYNLNGYGDTLEIKTVDVSNYQIVDAETFELAATHVVSYAQTGEGFTAEARRNSSGYRAQYIVIEEEKQVIVGDLKLDSIGFSKPIYLEDTVYNGKDKTATYNLAGKDFVFNCDFVPVYPKNNVGTVNFNDIEYQPSYGNTIAHDYADNRVLLYSNKVVSVLDINSLSIIKQFEFREEVRNILVHDNVYHIMTATKASNNGGYTGKIYVIDKMFLKADEIIDLNFYPYYTAIDKRGDIIIVPGENVMLNVQLYKKATKTVEEIEYQNGHRVSAYSYLSYDKEKDQFVTNDTTSTGAVWPIIYVYSNGKYVEKEIAHPTGKYTDYGPIYFSYRNYIIANVKLVDVSDWENPLAYEIFDSIYSSQYSFSFNDGDTIYSVTGDFQKQNIIVAKIDIDENGGFNEKVFSFKESVTNVSFGFAKDGIVYLFDNAAKVFYKYNLNK